MNNIPEEPLLGQYYSYGNPKSSAGTSVSLWTRCDLQSSDCCPTAGFKPR